MKTLLIVYHSLTGGTRQMAEAAAMGAATEPGVDVRLLQAAAAGPGDVLADNGYVFAAPENLAALAGLIKDFFDRCYYPVLGRINGRPYGLLICAGSDGASAARQAVRVATGWRLRAVAEPPIWRRMRRERKKYPPRGSRRGAAGAARRARMRSCPALMRPGACDPLQSPQKDEAWARLQDRGTYC